jgi:1,4-dihydroxy-2-naphthoate octaprenyltransferase
MSGSTLEERAPRAWTLWAASRPAQLLLIVAVYALGVVVAVARGAPLGEGALLAGVAALVPTVAGVHYANEYADHETDALTERTPFSGGSGALEATGVPRRLLATAAAVALSVGGVVAGLSLLAGLLPGRAVAILAGAGVLGVQYSVPPLALSRRGLGELTNAGLGGVALPGYGAAAVGGLDRAVMLSVLPFALLVFVNLLETGWPDRRADADVGKDTLAVRWPPRRLRLAYAVVTVAAFAALVGLTEGVLAPVPDVFPWTVTLSTLPAMPVFAWGTVRFTERKAPLPAVLGTVLVAALQLVAWGYVAFG